MSDVPGYLGRVLDASGHSVGTCFQVRPGILVTAWRVLDRIGFGAPGMQARVGPLIGSDISVATVYAVDELRDLAILLCDRPFGASAEDLVASDSVPAATDLQVTGVSDTRWATTSTTATWQGPAVRDDQVPLGVIDARNLVPGMSGAPVRRASDDRVVGVVSHASWVARTEDLAALLSGVATVPVTEAGLPGRPLDLTLTVSEDEVRLSGAGVDVSAPHGGIKPGLAYAIRDVFRERARSTRLDVRTGRDPAEADSPGQVASLRRAGELLGESFLPGSVRDALAGVIQRAQRETAAVRLAIDAPSHSGLPWEAIPDPVTQRPLALHPLVSVFRSAAAGQPAARPGPLRIVVAIASPDAGGGPLLDYEHELSTVLDAVRAARQDAAHVTIVPFATTAAIRAALDGAGVHVLHLSAHGRPGELILEDDNGGARPVTAATFVERRSRPATCRR